VSVPSVRVLGFGKRRVHISVPNRLANESVQWRTSAVEGDELPQHWVAALDNVSRSTYVVANPSWSIDLAPLPEVDAEAFAVTLDAQAFPQEDSLLVMCHWDLFPGSLEAVNVRLPQGAECVGAWSAGQPVVPEPALESSTDLSSRDILRVPLALSRLSQPIELLIRVPALAAKQADYLPELVGIPITQSWLTNYLPADASPSIWGDSSASVDDRALVLAGAVVDAVDAVEFINQRPRDEVVTWLQLWFARYRMLAESAGHAPDFGMPAEGNETEINAAASDALADSMEPVLLSGDLRWGDLDARMAVYAKRFLTENPSDMSSEPTEELSHDIFLFGVGDFDGFQAGRISNPSRSDPPLGVQLASHGDRGLRSLIISLLTLILIGGLLICLRPLQRLVTPTVGHPAFWLALMGVFGFAVAPLPVAAALILVAVALPVFPPHERSSAASVR
jgi:hypothetical protein